MEKFYQTLLHTPWWVYVLFGYVISIGIKASKTRIISIKKLFIMPAIFTYMSIHTLTTSVNPDTFAITTWSIAILLGISLGYWQIALTNIKVDKEKRLIQIPGSWSVLLIILVIFSTKYYFGYALAVDPHRAQQFWFEISLLGVSGACTGLFIGKLICFLKRMQTEPQTVLKAE